MWDDLEGFEEISNNNLKPAKFGNFILSIVLYIVCGLKNNHEFPWFVGDTLSKFQSDLDDFDGFDMLILFSWLIVFIGNAYFIYIDTNILSPKYSLFYSIIYILSYYQFMFILSIEKYYTNIDYYYIKYINYISVLIILAINGYIFSFNKYLLPKSKKSINIFFIHLFIFLYILLFIYETIFDKIIFKRKFITKCVELFLFFGQYILIIFYVSFQENEQIKQNQKIDEILYNMRIDVRNYNNNHHDGDDDDDDDYYPQHIDQPLAFAI